VSINIARDILKVVLLCFFQNTCPRVNTWPATAHAGALITLRQVLNILFWLSIDRDILQTVIMLCFFQRICPRVITWPAAAHLGYINRTTDNAQCISFHQKCFQNGQRYTKKSDFAMLFLQYMPAATSILSAAILSITVTSLVTLYCSLANPLVSS
jgi:hypothetical protein